MSECSKLLFKLYTWSTSKQRHTSFQSTVAGQLCVQLMEDKSQVDRMRSMCFKTFCWAQTVTYRHMWAKSDSWHVFCMVIMWSTFSQSCWHAESPESQETADDEGLSAGQGNGAEWVALHHGPGRRDTYQQPDAQGEKSPPLRRQIKLHYVLHIHAIKICVECIYCFEVAAARYSAAVIRLNYDMNAIPSNTVDGKSMTWMQVSNSSSVTTVLDNAWTEISTEPENIKEVQKETPYCRGVKHLTQKHMPTRFTTCANSDASISKRSSVHRRWMCS